MAFLTGCATIVSKSEYPVNISSTPDVVDITIKNNAGKEIFAGKTPATISLKAGCGYFQGEDYSVTFKKEGLIPQTAHIKRGVDGWYIAGNIVFGGLIGWFVVDPSTGAMWTLENLHVNLDEAKTASKPDTVRIVAIEDVPEALRSKMVKVN